MLAPITQRITVFLLKLLPARAMGRLIYRLSRSERPWLKNYLIRGFSWFYNVNLHEAEKRAPLEYPSFNAFFTRTLKSGMRPIDERTDSIVCPADGTIAQTGIAAGEQMLQAKGMHFSASALLGDREMAAQMRDCAFATIYLAPYNYHRLHMPLDGQLVKTIFIPGLLYSVNAATTATVPDLYAVNERLVCCFNSPQGPFTMTLVGAMNVASISTSWGGEIKPPANGKPTLTDYWQQQNAPMLHRGDYMGHFNMGSTVVFMAPPGICQWEAELESGELVRVGQRIGSIQN